MTSWNACKLLWLSQHFWYHAQVVPTCSCWFLHCLLPKITHHTIARTMHNFMPICSCWLIHNNKYKSNNNSKIKILKIVLAHWSWQSAASAGMLLAQPRQLACLKASAGVQTHNKHSLQEWHARPWAVQPGGAVIMYFCMIFLGQSTVNEWQACVKRCQWATQFCQSAVNEWKACAKHC